MPGTKAVSNVQLVTVIWIQELLVMVLITMSIVQAQYIYIRTVINFLPVLPKHLVTYPHREEDQGIDLAPLFL